MNSNPHDEVEARLRRAVTAGDDAPALSPALVTEAPGRRAPRLINHGRVGRAAGSAVLAVAAVTAGSLVIAQPWQTRAPLFTAAGASDQATLGAAAAPESSDMRIGVWKQYEYVAGESLATSGGSGSVYALERSGTPESTLTDISSVFDLVGEAMRSSYFDEAYPSYVVGPEDGTAPALTITWAGTASWWYNDPEASGWWSCSSPGSTGEEGVDDTAEAPAVEPTEEIAEGEILIDPIPEPEVCEPPVAAEGAMPTEDEARGEAADIFAATGLDVAASDIRIMADEWQTVASANLVVDGVTTALDWSVAWGPSGEISWAYGHAVDVVDKGEYGTVSEADAVSRLSDGRWFGAPGPDYQGGMIGIAEMARDASVSSDGMSGAAGEGTSGSAGGATEPQPAPDPGAGGTPDPMPSPIEPVDPEKPVEPAPVEPAPVEPSPGEPTPIDPVEPVEPPIVEPTPEPLPEPEVEFVTLTEADQTLLLVWDADGNAWLVPGHAYPMEEGWWSSVISLVEGVIALPEPIEYEIEPMPMPLPAEE